MRKIDIATIVLAVVVLLILFVVPAHGQVTGPGPCNSDTPWGCFPERVYLPAVIPAGGNQTPVVATPTPTRTPTPQPTSTATPTARPTIILISPTPEVEQ